MDLVVKMWLGVSGSRSPGSSEAVVKGLELIIASTSQMSVRNDSSSKQWPYSSIKPEDFPCGPDLALPYATQVAGGGWIEDPPVDVFFQ